MASQSLPPIASLETAPESEIADIIDYLFEPCPELHKILLDSLRTRSFSSYSQMIDSVNSRLTKWSESEEPAIIARLEEILGAHPRLGEKKVDSAQSRAEQAQLTAGDGSQESELMSLNIEYEKTFPGLRYVYVQIKLYGIAAALALINMIVFSSMAGAGR